MCVCVIILFFVLVHLIIIIIFFFCIFFIKNLFNVSKFHSLLCFLFRDFVVYIERAISSRQVVVYEHNTKRILYCTVSFTKFGFKDLLIRNIRVSSITDVGEDPLQEDHSEEDPPEVSIFLFLFCIHGSQ